MEMSVLANESEEECVTCAKPLSAEDRANDQEECYDCFYADMPVELVYADRPEPA